MEPEVLRAIDPREFGRRLQEARKARGRTQLEAAEFLNAARTTITAIEKGERRIQPGELVRLAAFYGRSVGELLRTGEPTEAFSVQLRASLATGAAGGEIGQEVAPYTWEFQRLCEDYLELERLCGAPLTRRYPEPYEIEGVPPEAAAEDAAIAERNRLSLGDGPAFNLRPLLETDVGLRIFYMDLPSRVAAMFTYTVQLGGCIAVNRKHPEDRRRMSLMHDYAHFLSNRHRPETLVLGRYHRLPEHERFAESFARAFLMPATGLRRRFNEIRRNRAGRVTPADLLTLAHLYFVSVEAMVRRLEEIDLIPSGTWDKLQETGFRVREAQAILRLPGHAADDRMLPVRYLYLAVEALERSELSEGQFARFLRIDRLEARRVAEELSSRPVLQDDGTVQTLPIDLGEALAHH